MWMRRFAITLNLPSFASATSRWLAGPAGLRRTARCDSRPRRERVQHPSRSVPMLPGGSASVICSSSSGDIPASHHCRRVEPHRASCAHRSRWIACIGTVTCGESRRRHHNHSMRPVCIHLARLGSRCQFEFTLQRHTRAALVSVSAMPALLVDVRIPRQSPSRLRFRSVNILRPRERRRRSPGSIVVLRLHEMVLRLDALQVGCSFSSPAMRLKDDRRHRRDAAEKSTGSSRGDRCHRTRPPACSSS